MSNFSHLKRLNYFASNKNKITKYENGDKVPNLEITVVVLAHCNNDYQQWLSTGFITCAYIYS